MKLPLGWKHAEIKDVAEVVTGSTPPTADPKNYDGDYLFITPGDIASGSIITYSARTVSKLGYNSGRPVPPYSTLVTCIGSSIGKTGISGEWSITNQQINAAIPLNVNSYFLFYAISNQSEQVRRLAGTQALPILPKSSFQRIVIALPTDAAEQERIGNLLLTWDSTIEKTGKLIGAKEKLFSWLIQSLISDPCKHWEHLHTEKMFNGISEKNNGDEELLSVTQDRGVIPRTMLEGRVMSPEGSTDAYKLVKEGDFVISLRSFQGGIEYSRYQGLISPAYTVLRPKLKIHHEFYRHFFKSYLFVEKYLGIAVIGIRDGKQISIPDFMTVNIPYPPLEQQKQIASVLNTARQEIDLLKKQVEAYHKQKRGLMQKLLTGKWRVKTDEGERVK